MSLEIMKFHHPFNCIVAGPTKTGKTYWVRKLLNSWKYSFSNIGDKDILKVLWCHGISQNVHKKEIPYVQIEYFIGLPTLDDIEQAAPDVVVIDDLMNELKNNKDIKDLFTKVAHHRNMSVILLIQNIFNKERAMRDISINTEYFVLMRGRRMTKQVQTFANQIFSDSKAVCDIYIDATRDKWSYLLLDSHSEGEDQFGVRTRVFIEDLPEHLQIANHSVPIVYELKEFQEWLEENVNKAL